MKQLPLFNEDEIIGQENEDDLGLQMQSSYSEAVIWATDWTTEVLVSQLKKGNIELSPSFQRRDAWNIDRKGSFIESIILGLPIPQIILAERKDKKGSFLVIDGKQRLLSIRQFCVTDDKDIFNALKLQHLSILKKLNGKTYVEINEDSDLHDFSNSFDNCSIRTIIIKNWPDQNFLYTVFLRLNAGSLPLSPQELRQALNPGEFTTFLEKFSEESDMLKLALNLSKPDYRMRDVEVCLRYFAYINFIEDYSGNLKLFLDNTCEKLNNNWDTQNTLIYEQAENLNRAIETTFEIFEENTFRKYSSKGFSRVFNRPVFDIMTYYFSNNEVRIKAIEKKEELINEFKNLCENNIEFLRSLETSTKNVEAIAIRFSKWGYVIKSILKIEIQIPNRANIGIKLV